MSSLGDKIVVRGFSKIGKIVSDEKSQNYVVEFEKIRIEVDKNTQTIILPTDCVTIKNY